MRCPFCESIPDIPDSTPVVCTELEYSLMEREPGEQDYEFCMDVEEYQCKDCGRSFFV